MQGTYLPVTKKLYKEFKMNKLMKYLIISGAALIVAIIIISNSVSVIGPTERGIKVTLGKANTDVIEPGIIFKAPFIDKLIKYDISPIQYASSFSSMSDGAITLDKQTILVNFELFWRYNDTELYEVATKYKSVNTIYQPLSTSLKGIIKDAVGKLSINEIIANQSQLTKNIMDKLYTEVDYLPIIIDKFTITNLDWSEEYDRQIEKTASLAQQVEQAKQQALIIEAEAQKQVKEAEAKQKALIINAEAKLQAEKLNAEASIAKAEGEAKSKKIKVDADAYEARMIAANQNAYARQWQYEIDLERAKRWNGKEVPDAAYVVPGTGAVVPLK